MNLLATQLPEPRFNQGLCSMPLMRLKPGSQHLDLSPTAPALTAMFLAWSFMWPAWMPLVESARSAPKVLRQTGTQDNASQLLSRFHAQNGEVGWQRGEP